MNLTLLKNRLMLLGLVFHFAFASVAQTYRINPTNWFVGMKDPRLQLLVRTERAAAETWRLAPYPGVRLLKQQNVENPNYVFLDLTIAATARPGQLTFTTPSGKRFRYELKGRSGYQPQGLSRADMVYLLMPDRFANADPSNDKFADMADTAADRSNPWLRHGGDLQGVTQRMGYLKELGVSALWLNPVIENDQSQTNEGGTMRSAYHGYGFTDHYQIDRRLGGNEAYKKMVETAHAQGIKVIQDAVYNHVGINHWLLKDMPMKSWLNQWPAYQQTSFKEQPLLDPHASQLDRKIMSDGWFMPFLPDLNHKNPMVANFLIQHALWTVETFQIDGWRIDTYMYNDMDFMNRCNTALLREYPKIALFGESLTNNVPMQAAFVKNNLKNLPFTTNLPSTVDNQLHKAFLDGLKQSYGWSEGVNRVYNTLAQDFVYQQPYDLITYLDNHDENRFLSEVGEDLQKYRMGLVWLLTSRGIPQIYYGTEINMKNFKNPTDAEVRKDFPGGWAGDTVNKFEREQRTATENETFDLIKKLAAIRANSDAIKNGKFMQYMPVNEGLYLYTWTSKSETILVATNLSKTTLKLPLNKLQESAKGATQGTNLLTNSMINLATESLGPMSYWVLRLN